MFGPGYGFGSAGATRRHGRSAGTPTPAPSATGTLTLSAIPAHEEKRIYQRATTSGGGQGKGVGNISLTISGALAGTVNVRILADDLTTILQTLADVTITNGQTSLLVAGVDARLGWFFIEVRGSNGVWQRTTYKCGMGALFGFAGQSLMVRFFGRQDGQTATYASSGLIANDNMAVIISYNDGNSYQPTIASAPWQTPGDNSPATLNGLRPNALGIGQFLNQMIALTGVNCGAFGRVEGGQELFTFIAGQGNWTILNTIITRIGGAFEGFFWGQGQSNSKSGTTANSYATGIGMIFAQLSAANSFAGYGKYVWTIPSYTSNQWGTPRQVNAVRKGGIAGAAAIGGTYVHMTDIHQIDGVHESQAGSVIMANHMYRAARAQYGASSGIGPSLVSASFIAAQTIRVIVTDVGQTALNLIGTPANRIFAMQAGRTNIQASLNDNRWPVSAVTPISKTMFDLTLANDPGPANAPDLWLYYPCGPNDTTADNIYDNRIDGDGIPVGRILQANAIPISVTALTPGVGAINNPPSGLVTGPSPIILTPGSATYAAAPGAFGQEMTGGQAVATTGTTAGFYPYTIEGWFVCPTITGAVQALFGGIGNDEYIGINTAGRINAIFGSGTKILVAGRRYYAAAQIGPSGGSLFLYDETLNAYTTERSFVGAQTMPPRNMTMSLRSWKGGFAITGGGAIDEWALFESERYANLAAFTANFPKTAPLTGAEANLVALFHCDGSVAEAVAA